MILRPVSIAILEIPQVALVRLAPLESLVPMQKLAEDNAACTMEIRCESVAELLGWVGQIRRIIPEAKLALAVCDEAPLSVRRRMLRTLLGSQTHHFPLIVGRSVQNSLLDSGQDDIVDLGFIRFEDLLSPEPVFALVPKGAIKPRLERIGLSLLDNNLPPVFDSFVGRDKELESALDLLQKFALVTIKGPGGIGKTRFGMHLAAKARHLGAEVVRFIPLAEIHLDDQVKGQVLRSFKASGQKLGVVLDIYRKKNLVLVLDNCEHVEPGVRRLVQEILNELPLCRIIATSRHVLGLKGEAVFELDTLDLPEKDIDSLQSISETGAGELFLDRFEEQGSRNKLDQKEASAIVSLLHLVDGVPLAVEHAAYQAALCGVQECWESLERSLLRLSGSETAYEPRHQTIRATLKWSLDLLSDEQRSVTQTLAVFRGQFDSRDFRVLTGFSEETEKLWELYRRSIVRKSGVVDGRQYFQMTEAFRQFVLEGTSSQTIADVEARYAPHAYQMCVEANASSLGRASLFDFRDVFLRYPAIFHAVRSGIVGSELDALAAARALVPYWYHYGPATDGVSCFAQVESAGALNAPQDRHLLGVLLWLSGRLPEAQATYSKVLPQLNPSEDFDLWFKANLNSAQIAGTLGQIETALELTKRLVEVSEENGLAANALHARIQKARLLLDADRLSEAASTLSCCDEPEQLRAHDLNGAWTINFLELQIRLGNLSQAASIAHDLLRKILLEGVSEAAPAVLLRVALLLSTSDLSSAALAYGGALELYCQFPSKAGGKLAIVRQLTSPDLRLEADWGSEISRGRSQSIEDSICRLLVALSEQMQSSE